MGALKKYNADRNYPRFHTICNKFGINYKSLVLEVTEGKSDSLSRLADSDYFFLLNNLVELDKTSVTIKAGDKQRKKMLSIAGTMQWGDTMEELKQAVNSWCMKQKFKKTWMMHTPEELNVLVSILELQVLPSYYRGLNK
ncbi:MAG: hypothetical protein V4663_06055 [Bacteroidota bacterium]